MTSDPTTSNQRRDPRYDADLPVQLLGGDGDVAGNLRNVSVSGAAIEFDPSLGKPTVMFEIGDSVDLQADVGQASNVATRGVVVRSDENGIAVKFDKPEEDLMAEILSAVRRVIEQNE
jgi:hypothetical protein